MSAQYVLVNVRVLSTANCELDELDSYRRLLHDNLLFPWVMLLHMSQFLHLSDDMCTLFFKNFISNVNQFHPDYTSRIKDGYLDIVARNTRRHLTNPNENQDDLKIHRFNKANRAIVSSLSRTRMPGQVDECLEVPLTTMSNAVYILGISNDITNPFFVCW